MFVIKAMSNHSFCNAKPFMNIKKLEQCQQI